MKVKINQKFKKNILACGGHLKNTFCLGLKDKACVSRIFGSLEMPENVISFKNTLKKTIKHYKFMPEIIACDLHPDYLSTKYVFEIFNGKFNYSPVFIQHHHAHIASCMADNGIEKKVIGVAFDGTGLGTDGNIWGGEFLIGDYKGFERAAHLDYVSMPGGNKCILEPMRMTLSYLYKLFGKHYTLHITHYTILIDMIDKGINSPLTSSMGRLFDAVSALIGIKKEISFEGEAAIELEKKAAKKYTTGYKFDLIKKDGEIIISAKSLFRQILEDLEHKKDKSIISAKFHSAVCDMVVKVCGRLRDESGINTVCLSGGVFQNKLLSAWAAEKLAKNKFKVLTHKQIPTNDAGISLGQAVIANAVSRHCESRHEVSGRSNLIEIAEPVVSTSLRLLRRHFVPPRNDVEE